jgi:hypothetical protein
LCLQLGKHFAHQIVAQAGGVGLQHSAHNLFNDLFDSELCVHESLGCSKTTILLRF